jgi:hypothetical protein
MPLTYTTLGNVLLHIYDFDPGAGIYLPSVDKYEADTPCMISSLVAYSEEEFESQHKDCLNKGFINWLNVAVVSDTCDEALQTESSLLAAFNNDCREGGWLWKMMNYLA